MLALEKRDEHSARAEYVIAHQAAGLRGVAFACGGGNGSVFVTRARLTVGERQLHSEIPIAVMVQLADDAHRQHAIGRRIERRMELPIERTPDGDLP